MACARWILRVRLLSPREPLASSYRVFSSHPDQPRAKMTTRAKSSDQLVDFAKTKKVRAFLCYARFAIGFCMLGGNIALARACFEPIAERVIQCVYLFV